MARPFSCIFSVFTAVALLILPSISAQTRGNIAVGRSLLASKDSSSWRSPSDEFAFGFHELPNNSNLFLLAIWYAKIPDTLVWYANEGNPVPQGSNVTLTADAGLVLKDPQGTHLWNTSSEWNRTVAVSYGLMNDAGNFVIRSQNNASAWESFQHPTDTLLPSQIMGRDGELISRLSETNYTIGRFRLALQADGNLVLGNRELMSGFAYTPYYNTGTYQSPNQGYQLVFNESGFHYLVSENGTYLYNFTSENLVSSNDFYERATLNFYGVFTWYSHPKRFTAGDDSRWSALLSIPGNICTETNGKSDSGACGHNSICQYDDTNQRPSCSCPPYYSLLDPNDKYSGCQPNFTLPYCEDGQDAVKGGYQLVEVQNSDWPNSDYEQLENSSEDECKSSCLNDCFCLAAISRSVGGDAGTCWKKMLPLSNGKIDKTRTAWLKVRNDTNFTEPFSPMNPPSKVKSKTNTVISVLLGGSAFINMALVSAIIIGVYFFYNKKQPQLLKPFEESGHVRCFSYKVLEDATNGFSEELGRGAFGVVYKGMITAAGKSQNDAVAIKKLDRMSNDIDKEFQSEVNTIGKTHHRNLVHLVGYCKEENQRLLVYEYMSNGTLAEFIFGDLRPSWVGRVQIAQGVARGLLYLHEECSTQIIHCDIKPQNILLDEYHRARISDFGLAKLLVLNQTHTNTAVRGTKGYVAPEWFRNKPITVKVDVYSFGVLLLEIICCRKNVCMTHIEEGAILTDKAFDCYQSNTLHTMVDDDMEALEDSLRLKRFLLVALWCVQEDPSLRPTMRLVTQMLDGLAEVPELPSLASFSLTGTVTPSLA